MNDFTPKPLNVQKLVDMMKNNLPELFIGARRMKVTQNGFESRRQDGNYYTTNCNYY